MTLPMVGTWRVEVQAVRPFAIHGDRYFELQIVRTDDTDAAGGAMLVRAPSHAFGRPPAPGDRLTLAFLMGQITSAKPTPAV